MYPSPDDLTLPCKYDCGAVLPMLSWQEASNGVVHLRADCPSCKRWIKYLPQRVTVGGIDRGPTIWARAMGVFE